MSELIFLEPVFKETLWGGDKLTQFGYELPSKTTGECWAISAHEEGECKVASGEFKGKGLQELWKEHPEVFGNEDHSMGEQFPLLVKLIDAKEDLSIQVHPDDKYAAEHENGALGKMECWYILDCKEDATIIVGHQAKNKDEVKRMLEEKRWKDFIREIPIKKGDFFQIDPGCVHAIKGGTFLLETQQSSNITYRVYDYDRLYHGQLRPLHIEDSIQVIKAPFKEEQSQRKYMTGENVNKEHLETCSYYTLDRYEVQGIWRHRFLAPFTNVSVVEGEGTINKHRVRKGINLIIPAGYGICELAGNFTFLCSSPTRKEEVRNEKQISIEVTDWVGRTKAFAQRKEYAVLTMEDIYEKGDKINIYVPEINQYYRIRIDDTMDEELVYMTKHELQYEIPFEEKKRSYNVKSFTGWRHYLTCRKANVLELRTYRNLAKNVMDQHENQGCYPHASANVETRGESVFAARNAIDGVVANHCHGSWPYESWGINKQEDAQMLLEFGRPVKFDTIVLWTRADFPHDNWWKSAVLSFSDGTKQQITMEKSRDAHVFSIEKRNITWIQLSNLIKSEEASPFPALTQIEVYGKEE